MDSNLSELFEQARRIVADHERQRAEREAMLRAFAQTIDAAFDFTAREKSELDPRMDVMEGRGVLQFVVQGYPAIFLLSEGHGRNWGLQVADEDLPLDLLAEIEGGVAGDLASRRLAAARVICAIGDWVARHEPSPALTPSAGPELVKRDDDQHEAPELASVAASAQDAGDNDGRRPPPPVPQFGKSFGY